ncbi:Fc receptor-like protein 5 [Paramisgurnus dabryanus]|uniref:Fc receptor-like protein 5 n=1 Tax=Paramisgurnus dabryanus TaxID=90735 RepID=UPI003CCFCD60
MWVLISNIPSGETEALPRVTVRVTPDRSVFTGETVTLKCEIDQYRSLNWRYLWYKNTTKVFNSGHYTVNRDSLTINGVNTSDQVEYWCSAERDEQPPLSSSPVNFTVKALPRATLSVKPDRFVFTGETVTLKCEIEDQYRSLNWRYQWYKRGTKVINSGRYTVNRDSLTINGVTESDQDEFRCSAEIHGRPQTSLSISAVNVNVNGSKPKPKLTSSEGSVLTDNTVTLKCHIDHWSTGWKFYWYKKTQITEKTTTQTNSYTIHSVKVSDGGQYWCRAGRGKPDYYTDYSDGLWINVKDKPQTVLSVSPQQWLTEGDSVTLMCEVINSSTGWTFSWFTVQSLYSVNKDVDHELVSVSSGGSKGIYTVSSVTVKHTGVYMCRAERGDPVYHTEYSNTQTLWITGVSPSVFLTIIPDRSQHFSFESLYLNCEDHSKSTGWTVRRYTDKLKPCSSSYWRSTGTGSKCTISYLYTSDTGVYWCQSESEEKLHPVNISVHYADVILDSPVHPVAEGDPLTLRCLYRYKKPSNLRAEFYKDGSVVQSQTTGYMMIIPTVSKSHEGFYYCKYPERGESPKSWISVRAAGSSSLGLINSLGLGLSVVFLIFFLVLLWWYNNNKNSQSHSAVSQQQNISQTSDQKQTEDVYCPLPTGQSVHSFIMISARNLLLLELMQ